MTEEKNICKYCSKEFRKASSLAAHMCEPKRRWQQENETGVRFGLTAYLRFYELTQGTSKDKNYATFVESPYYTAFVKFGQYLVAIKAVNPTAYIDWIIKNNKKLDMWTKDSYYDEYLLHCLRTEHPQDALERALKEMEHWAEANSTTFNHFFLYGNPNRLCQLINNGRISPWVLYNCESGVEFLGKLTPPQLEIIYTIIDPSYWNRKLEVYADDTKWVKEVLAVAGL